MRQKISQKLIPMNVLERICMCLAACVWSSFSCFKNVTTLFFKPVNNELSDPNGELSATVSLVAVREANREVVEVTESGKRKP